MSGPWRRAAAAVAALGLGAGVALMINSSNGDRAEARSFRSHAARDDAAGAEGSEPPPPTAIVPADISRFEGCRVPWLPDAPGTRWHYRMEHRGREAGRVELTLLRTRGGGVGSTATLEWALDHQSRIDRSDVEPGRFQGTSSTHCRPGEWAESPWLRMPDGGGLRISGRGYRWPASLSPGDHFGGPLTHAIRARQGTREIGRTQRSYQVVAVEPVEVPAGSYDALRIDAHDETTIEGRTSQARHTLWLAPDVGMVRAVVDTDGARVVHELVKLRQPDG